MNQNPYEHCPKCGGNHTKTPAPAACRAAIMKSLHAPKTVKAPAKFHDKNSKQQKAMDKVVKGIKTTEVGQSPDFEADENTGVAQNDGDLARVSKLAMLIMEKEDEIANIEAQLSTLNQDLLKLQTETLPGLMDSLRIEKFSLTDGSAISIKKIIQASIPSLGSINKEKDPGKKATMQDRRERAFAYLNSTGAGAIIKTILLASLGKDAKKLAAAAIASLKKLGIEASSEETVHAASLTSLVKERMADGQSIDMDLLAVYDGKKAEIKRPKAA